MLLRKQERLLFFFLKKMYVLHVAGFHVDATSRSRHDRARFVLASAGIAYTECTVNRAGVSFPDAELPQLCVQDPNGNLRVLGGMDAIDRLNDEGRLRAECEEFKAAKRREYEARKHRREEVEAVRPVEAVEAVRPEAVEAVEAVEADRREAARPVEALRSVEVANAEIAAARRTAAEAVRSAELAHAELEAMERNAARLEKKLAVVTVGLGVVYLAVTRFLPMRKAT